MTEVPEAVHNAVEIIFAAGLSTQDPIVDIVDALEAWAYDVGYGPRDAVGEWAADMAAKIVLLP